MPTQLTGAPVIRWRNKNIQGILDIQGTNIYRSTSPMDINNMPTPYDTVADDTPYFIDTGAVYGTTYYYRVGVFDTVEEKITTEEIKYIFGNTTLMAPFDVEIIYYETDSGDLKEPFSVSSLYNKFLGE